MERFYLEEDFNSNTGLTRYTLYERGNTGCTAVFYNKALANFVLETYRGTPEDNLRKRGLLTSN